MQWKRARRRATTDLRLFAHKDRQRRNRPKAIDHGSSSHEVWRMCERPCCGHIPFLDVLNSNDTFQRSPVFALTPNADGRTSWVGGHQLETTGWRREPIALLRECWGNSRNVPTLICSFYVIKLLLTMNGVWGWRKVQGSTTYLMPCHLHRTHLPTFLWSLSCNLIPLATATVAMLQTTTMVTTTTVPMMIPIILVPVMIIVIKIIRPAIYMAP